jgi:hypothetical protein
MNEKIALETLYNATRMAALTAQQHEYLAQCAQFLADKIASNKPVEETVQAD